MAEINDSANSSVERQLGSADQVTIDIPANKYYWKPQPECCIHRVPIDLRRINTEAYTPQVISIGPFHYGNEELIAMEKQKSRYINIFSERNRGKEKLVEMKSYIESQEQNIRNCYYEQSFYKSKLLSSLDDQFVDMILYDAVFIIELFLRHYWNVVDFLLENPRYRNNIKRDLQLFENQLPYFILNKLYDLAIKGFDTPEGSSYKGSSYKDPSFLHISCVFFGHDMRRVDGFQSSIDVKHFTDLRRYFLIENHPTSNTEKELIGLPCATMLDESGVRFRCVENPDGLLDIKYGSGFQLQIPAIMVNDWTEVLIRNVMALEQCSYPTETHVCNYIAFMDFLINTEKDVDFLIEKGIIVNCLVENANAAIMTMLKNLSLHISLSSSAYYSMGEDLKVHYDSHSCVRYWNRNTATLKNVYFRDIWTGTATVAAFVLLVLTFVQAVCSILSLL